ELVTGDYLFEPKASSEYCREEDHLALIIELLGPMPMSLLARSKQASELFAPNGSLLRITSLTYWGLECVFRRRYRMSEEEASYLTDFLLPMLEIEPNKRA